MYYDTRHRSDSCQSKVVFRRFVLWPNAPPKTLYLKVENDLRRQIANGHLSVGQRIPREDELCSIHKVSPITVRRAMTNLADQGLIARVPRRGHLRQKLYAR